MLEPRFRWLFPPPVALDPRFVAVGARLGLGNRALEVLKRRGLDTAELETWVGPAEAGLCDPGLLPDAVIFVERIRAAIAAGDPVLVFGDFDADGLTGLAILCRTFVRLGIDARPYVPSRVEEGHGLSLPALDAAVAMGAALIVTVDCGTSSREEIAEAVRRGIDVIVTDHHRVPAELPPALALVNPHRPDSRYPHRRLAGSGVAFKLAQLLLADEAGGPAAAMDLVDLATIGTVADVSPILGENRSIARLGLDRMRSDPRSGVAALLSRSGAAGARISLETVSFALAPRINAAGRMGDAMDAAHLLLTDDPDEAERLADRLDVANVARRQLTRDVVEDAEAAITALEVPADARAVVVRGPWPVGIVGLVAARIAERRGLPAVVGAQSGESIRASCRSGPGIDLAEALGSCADLLVRHGGHRGAAGFEIAAEHWDAFAGRFHAIAAAAIPADVRPELTLDLVVEAIDVDYRLLAELAGLAPTGPGNPEVLMAVRGLTVTRVRAANGGHAQLTLRRRVDVLDGIAFNRPDLAEVLREGDRVDVAARLTSRVYGGNESLQLEIRDVAISGTHARMPLAEAGPTALATAVGAVQS